MAQRNVFIPEGVVRKHRTDALEFGLSDAVAEIDGLMCPGSTVSLETELLDVLLQRFRIEVIPEERAIIGDKVFEVARAHCDSYLAIPPNHPAGKKIDEISEELAVTLETFGSRLGFTEVGMHFLAEPQDFLPPRKGLPGRSLTIAVGGGPVGLINTQHVATLCGTRLTEDGGVTTIRSHSNGYGGILKDDQDSVIAQIVDSMFYLTIPSKAERFITHFSTVGTGLFGKMLHMAWNRKDTASPPMKRTAVEDPDMFAAKMLEYDRECVESYRRMLQKARLDLEALERKLTNQIIHVRNLDQICAGIGERIKIPERIEKLRAAFLRLKEHHLVDQIMVTGDEFFEVWTKPVFIEHEGATYGPFGPYVVTFIRASGVIIRCRDEAYKNLYVHPHVPIDTGSPCFGNATRAIESALVGEETRPAGIELTLEWLESGYDHGIAAIKVTEWPRVPASVETGKEVANAT